MSEAVRRMTSLPALTFGMLERGQIKEGYFADLVLFDPLLVLDQAPYDDPKQPPIGIKMVVVNGEIALSEGLATGVGSGQMLRYKRGHFESGSMG